MKKALLFGIVLCGAVLSLATCSTGATVLSMWGGAYASTSGGGTGVISSWKFSSDKTTTGVWADTSGVVSIAVDGTYANNAGNLTMTAAGTATSTLASSKNSPYSLNCSGYMGSTTGYGTYTISFSVWGTNDSGTWTIVRQ